jgi:hypothetical protein
MAKEGWKVCLKVYIVSSVLLQPIDLVVQVQKAALTDLAYTNGLDVRLRAITGKLPCTQALLSPWLPFVA